MNSARRDSIRLGSVFFIILVTVILLSGPAWAKRMCVDADIANIRSGPGTEYEVLWRAEKYTPIETIQVDKSGDWYYFKDFEGTKAWIHKNIIAGTDTVITRKGPSNVRSGPGTNFDTVFQAEKGVPFKVLERKGDWIHIQHADGDTGWIHKILVW